MFVGCTFSFFGGVKTSGPIFIDWFPILKFKVKVGLLLMLKVKVILNSSHGVFIPDEKLQKIIDKVGIPLFSLEGRTFPDYVHFIESKLKRNRYFGNVEYSYLTLSEVDTSRPWYIDDYDNAEFIQYADYKVINKELNYVEMIE